ncbi:hypothetical protein A8924_6016 [Saccharopolyspora erythraea NRRL 2338]|uniref:Uncharacterized protein n=2 Tax=Saccharopolyspora erythraea TaxID=1836 RepID=A4FLD4_SACEN|nr:hypothetical protein [Saccharopolyspora erythraea]PFG98500.1 hypothetical protein A8924_6016 [Saccharopolyspora erythraea NRRL 2338]QRK88553.1 hypothetical protein JQX30_28445 [Saccharopolyspora erythraea]CAM04859.1 hypothetical protein SACE_5673 [Saccharopolyspora erythraea NRRL 2338]
MVRTEFSIYAMTPEKDGVFHFHDGSWVQVGGPAARLFGGNRGLVATTPDTGDLFMYLNTPFSWAHIGGPGASFAVTGDSVYGLSKFPGGGGVFRYDGSGMSWTEIGSVAGEIYGGPWGLVATTPDTGDLFMYLNTPFSWAHIGGPGASFAVTGDSVYGLSKFPGGGGVFRYDGSGMSWTEIGSVAGEIYGGPWGLVATNPDNGELFGFQFHSPEDNPDNPPQWRHIGGPGASFAVSLENIFGLSTNPDGGGVFRFDGDPANWTRIGGPANSIVAALWTG